WTTTRRRSNGSLPLARSITGTPTRTRNIEYTLSKKVPMEAKPVHFARVQRDESQGPGPKTIDYIHAAAQRGLYEIRGLGAKRRVPHFDDLLFLGASVSRYPLEGYRERCATGVTIGTRFASAPIHLDIPITIAGMSFGALSGHD